MATSYPDRRNNARGIWTVDDITKNIKTEGTFPLGAVRAVCFGGETPSLVDTIDFVQMESTGDATDFGDLAAATANIAGMASFTRGIAAGGNPTLDVIQYVTIVSTGNTTDFGDTTEGARANAGASNSVRGLRAGGHIAPANTNVIDYITMATTGNATDFGDRTATVNSVGGLASSTRAIFGGGSPNSNILDYVTINTTGNAIDFGDLTAVKNSPAGSNSFTRGLFSGGQPVSPIDSIQIASLGNATDFGDLATGRAYLGSTDNSIKSITYAGSETATDANKRNEIEYVQIATAGTAVDFGDASVTRGATQATISNGHGGLDVFDPTTRV